MHFPQVVRGGIGGVSPSEEGAARTIPLGALRAIGSWGSRQPTVAGSNPAPPTIKYARVSRLFVHPSSRGASSQMRYCSQIAANR